MPGKSCACVGGVVLAIVNAVAPAQVVSLEGLLEELNDRTVLTRMPDPAYTCRQFSSYDRNATAPGDDSWFANADAGHFLRTEKRHGRDEYVMMDASGPGAIVRIWSANPKGTLRIYIDENPIPVIEGKMGKLLDAGGLAPAPLAGVRSRGYNLYLPIPYARRCVVTSDEPGFYYQINYRTYEPGTIVASLSSATLVQASRQLRDAAGKLLASDWANGVQPVWDAVIAAGAHWEKQLDRGGRAIEGMVIQLDQPENWDRALRSLVLEIEFDGNVTVWAPVGDFFGSGIGLNALSDRMRQVSADGTLACGWIMPYRSSATIRLHNFGSEDLSCAVGVRTIPYRWDDRAMYFHATWREQRDIPTRPMRDWNYVTIDGTGVLVGDTLTVTNPVEQWWGEGDEKIYVDGESFPSHFGTGTEDYYGYAWCCPEPFQSPLHAQVRCDGHAYNNNYGTTTVTRLRSLDAIPFQRSLRFDMELWHWADTRISQSAATYFYARPGARCNVQPDPAAVSKAPPAAPVLPPPLVIEGAAEGETLEVIAASEGLNYGPQGGFGLYTWSRGQHLWVRATRPGDFIELRVPSGEPKAEHLYARLTRSWDYAIISISVNGQVVVDEVDTFNTDAREVTTQRVDLGTHKPQDGGFVVRFEVIGSHERSEPPGTYFGIDCIEREPAD